MLHVDRRAQLILPQDLHIQSSALKSPPLFSAAFFPMTALAFSALDSLSGMSKPSASCRITLGFLFIVQ